MRNLALAILCIGMSFGLVSTGIAHANGSGQVVFTNSVSGLAGMGTGTFTYGGVTVDNAQIGFSIHCSLTTGRCNGAFYVAPIVVTSHGQALTITVSGTINEVSSGVYTITLISPAAVSGCTLTNSGAPAMGGGATPTQDVTVTCTGNGTTTLSGGGTASGIVNVTDQ
jgi:hypothetical protein